MSEKYETLLKAPEISKAVDQIVHDVECMNCSDPIKVVALQTVVALYSSKIAQEAVITSMVTHMNRI